MLFIYFSEKKFEFALIFNLWNVNNGFPIFIVYIATASY